MAYNESRRLQPGQLFVLVMCLFTYTLSYSEEARNCNQPLPGGRSFWVYMNPCEAVQLYDSPDFPQIRAYADNFVANGMENAIGKIDHRLPWVGEAEKAIESVSAVYMALKWGQYGGTYHSDLSKYLTFVTGIWNEVIATPLNTWTYRSSTNWYEGDITLRYWLHGAYSSYDAIRQDLPSTDRNKIDTWLRGLANAIWSSTENEMVYADRQINRGTSAFGQCQLIALLLQDAPLFESYFNSLNVNGKKRGFKQILDIYGFDKKVSCSGIPNSFGISDELRRRDGIHGIIVIVHGFNAMQNISHAARNGGSENWDLLYEPYNDPDSLRVMLDFWHRIGYGDLYDGFNDYVTCVEGDVAFWDPVKYNLKGKVAESFSWLDDRYDNVTWGYTSEMEKLWNFRGAQLRTTSTDGSDIVGSFAHPPVHKQENGIRIVSNSVQGHVNVDISIITKSAEVNIFDVSGKRVYQKSHAPGVLTIKHSLLGTAGMYIIKIDNRATSVTSRFQIAR